MQLRWTTLGFTAVAYALTCLASAASAQTITIGTPPDEEGYSHGTTITEISGNCDQMNIVLQVKITNTYTLGGVTLMQIRQVNVLTSPDTGDWYFNPSPPGMAPYVLNGSGGNATWKVEVMKPDTPASKVTNEGAVSSPEA